MKKCLHLLLISIGLLAFLQGNAQNAYLSLNNTQPAGQTSEDAIPDRVVNTTGNSVTLEYTFKTAKIAETTVDGTAYQFVQINGFSPRAQVGAPAVPSRTDLIALPADAQPRIVIHHSQYIDYEGYMLHPTLQPARDTEGAPEPEFQIDAQLYATNAFYPEKTVETVEIQKMRGTPIAFVQLNPVQFNPASGTLRIYSQINYTIEFAGGSKSFDYIAAENSLNFTNLLKSTVLNPTHIPDGQLRDGAAKSGKDYIIITHQQYLTAANDLAQWKRQLGYSVEVVSQASWTATQVKDAIHSRYSSWSPKPDYFVIIGDHDGSYAVPGEIHYDPDDNDPFATDLYYACMDGSSDYIPDMAHGRISVSSLTEANTIVQKIIDYEKNPPTLASYYTTGLNCAQYQDDDNNGYADRRFCHTAEDVRDYLTTEQSYNVNRVYYTSSSASVSGLRYNNDIFSTGGLLPADLRSTSFDWNGGASDITSEINSGRFYVLHRDHGYVGGSGWAHPYYTTSSMTSLSNGSNLPVVFSINCHTGEFRLSNCFAEKFLRMSNKGAVGVVGAAYYSLSGHNDAIVAGMFDAIWPDPGLTIEFGSGGVSSPPASSPPPAIYAMGDVVNQGLARMLETWAYWSSYFEYSYQLFHYFGDPAMKLWTSNPNNNVIAATHSSSIDCSLNTFSISGSEPEALATLVYNNEIIGQTTLDASGNGSIPYSIATQGTGDVVLTISKHNSKPYTAALALTGSCGFAPAVITAAATNVLGDEATLNGEITDDQGETVTESGFVYATSPDPMIGGTGVTAIQTAPTVTFGTFSETITGLSAMTTYYYRAYAINSNGTGYGSTQSFTTACGVVNLPYSESFDNTAFPNCWTQSSDNCTDRWTIATSSEAGGTANEAQCGWENTNPATTRLITPAINTSGLSELSLTFKHYLDDYGSGATLKIQSSPDGVNWTDQSWSTATGNGDIGPETVETNITNISSATIYIAFTITGNLYQYDNWYIDDINVNEPCEQIEIEIITDNYGDETTWELRDSNGDVLISGGPYTTGSQQTDVQTICLPNDCYEFEIFDSFGDGMCCDYGNGSWTLTNLATGEQIGTGGSFTDSETQPFCLGISDMAVSNVYTLGQLPKEFGTPHTPMAQITNLSTTEATNLDVTLNIAGANTFSNTKTISSVAAGETITVTFDDFTPSATGTNTVSVSIPDDGDNSNNTGSYTQEVTDYVFAYSDNSGNDSNIGFGTSEGLLLARYHLNGTAAVKSVRVYTGESSMAGYSIRCVLLDASGTILGYSNDYTIQAGDINTWVSYDLIGTYELSNTDFYVGVEQTAAAISLFPVGTQTESPACPNAFYTAALDGTMLTNQTGYNRWMIGAELCEMPEQPSAISGNTTVCENTQQTYSVTNVSGMTYTWDLPTGWTGTSTSNSITVTPSANSGTITVTPSNGCGTGTAQTLSVNVTQIPAAPSTPTGNSSLCVNPDNTTYTTNGATGATYYVWNLQPSNAGSISGTTTSATVDWDDSYTGTATITVTGANDCGTGTASDALTVTISTVPAQPSAISGDATVCENATSLTYSVSPQSNVVFSWALPAGWTGSGTSNSITVTAGTQGGTISVTPNNQCGSGTAQSMDVVVQPNPVANYTYAVNDLEVTFTNNSLNADSYLWNFGDATGSSTLESPVYTYASEGTYYVELTAESNVCDNNTYGENITVDVSTSISRLEEETGIRLFPNPSHGLFNLQFEETDYDSVTIRIFALDGSAIYHKTYDAIQNGSSTEIDLQEQPAGVYNLQITTSKGVFNQLIIIE